MTTLFMEALVKFQEDNVHITTLEIQTLLEIPNPTMYANGNDRISKCPEPLCVKEEHVRMWIQQ